MFKPSTHLLVALAIAAITLFQTDAKAQSLIDSTRTIQVTGIGTVSREPDMAEISAGVITEAATAAAALEENSSKMKAILDGMKKFGIEDKNIQTLNFSVQPKYTSYKNSGSAPKIEGYTISNTVRIKITNLDKMGAALDKFVTLGANNISGISFGFSNEDELKNQARTLAAQNARLKASNIASGLNLELGDVLLVTEYTDSMPRPYAARTMAMESASVPIAAGEQSISVSVNATFEIKSSD